MLRIGNIQLDTPLLLAPIAGHCDLPFRLVARSCGSVGIAYTDLLCPHGLLKENDQSLWLASTNKDDKPLGMQLYGQDPDLMARAALWAVDHGATIIDINMGCPVDKVTKTFAGSMMLCTPDATVNVARKLVQTVSVPVTAKMRLGFHDGPWVAPQLAQRLADVGVAAITIHGRTAAQRFKGTVDLSGIAAVVEAMRHHPAVPVIGNGDIHTPFDAVHMFNKTGCRAVMIGRAALEAPWIFRDTHALLTTGSLPAPLTLRQRLDCVRRHFHHVLALRTPRHAIQIMRQKIGGYGKHLGPCRPLKEALAQMTDPAQFEPIIEDFLTSAGPHADEPAVTWEQRKREYELSRAASPPKDRPALVLDNPQLTQID